MFYLHNKKMGLYRKIQALEVSASTNSFKCLFARDAAVLLKQEREFASARRDGGDCARAVAILTIGHLVGVGLVLVLALGELRGDGLLSDLDFNRALIGFGNDHRIGSLLNHFIADLAVKVERNFLLNTALSQRDNAENQNRYQRHRATRHLISQSIKHYLPLSPLIRVVLEIN